MMHDAPGDGGRVTCIRHVHARGLQVLLDDDGSGEITADELRALGKVRSFDDARIDNEGKSQWCMVLARRSSASTPMTRQSRPVPSLRN